MKIFTGAQIRELDNYTIEHEPITSIDLMERAARVLARAIADSYSNTMRVMVFAGPGNNGGDALAVSRMLLKMDYHVKVFLFNVGGHLSDNCMTNRKRLIDSGIADNFIEVTTKFDTPELDSSTLVIDGLFGSGLDKPLNGGFATLVKFINSSAATVVSLDVPSGLMTEDNMYNVRSNIICADLTLTLQQKKLSFLFPENQQFIGELRVLDIRLSEEGINSTETNYYQIEEQDVRQKMLHREDFAHKGSMGTALLVAGSYGMAGAAVLASKACLRSGVGKVVVVTPKRNNDIMQMSVPEAITKVNVGETYFSESIDSEGFDALGIGPGLGMVEDTAIALIAQLRRTQVPIVIDADAINILSNHRAWMQQLPRGVILTPHLKEFDRLEGHSQDNYERLFKATDLARRIQGYVLLKGHVTALCTPEGKVVFNSTGNSGMATSGSGDVLTGILTGLLARGYKREDACIVGMYLHGLAGDLAADEVGKESLIASDIIRYLPKAFLKMND
jgi:hydroxyethylthiazole kinase-like uncharacterized protein yjeF